MSVRFAIAFRTAASTSTACARKRHRIGRLEADGPEVRHLRVENQRAQPIFRLLDGGLRHDHGLLVPRHFGLRLDDVDRRHGADLDALLVVGQQPLREVERLLLRLQVVDLVRQVPVGVLHVARRRDDRGLQLHVGGLAVFPAGLERLPQVVDLEVLQQRLRDVERHVRAEQRVEVGEEVGRRRAGAVPRERVVRAGLERLRQAELRSRTASR